jgi:hypothetical protein
MCTNVETYNTGINIDTVKLSNKNSHDIDRYSESIQLLKGIVTGDEPIPTS